MAEATPIVKAVITSTALDLVNTPQKGLVDVMLGREGKMEGWQRGLKGKFEQCSAGGALTGLEKKMEGAAEPTVKSYAQLIKSLGAAQCDLSALREHQQSGDSTGNNRQTSKSIDDQMIIVSALIKDLGPTYSAIPSASRSGLPTPDEVRQNLLHPQQTPEPRPISEGQKVAQGSAPLRRTN